MTDLSAVHAEYRSRGFEHLVPLKGKKPWDAVRDCALKDWTTCVIDKPQVQFGGSVDGIGLRLGDELKDVDLDSPVAVKCASVLLPPTMTYGRNGRERGHYIYRCPELKIFKENQTAKVELRGDGGHQSALPPSNGSVPWNARPPAEIGAKRLLQLFDWLTACVLIARHWHQGSRDKASLSLIDVLNRKGFDDEEIEKIIRAICKGADDEELDMRLDKIDDKDKSGKKYGFPTLKEFLHDDFPAVMQLFGIAANDDEEWEEPINILEGEATVEPARWPEDFLPGRYCQYAQDIAKRVQTPVEIVASGLIVSTLATVGTYIEFRPKQHDPYRVAALMWSLTVCPSGQRKSAALDAALRPMYRVERALVSHWKKCKDFAELVEADDFNPGPFPTMIVQSYTREGLAKAMVNGPLLLHLDEGASFTKSMNQYRSKGDDREFYMTSHNGTHSYTVLRANSSDNVYIPRAYLCLAALIQPEVAIEHLRSAQGLSSGFAARHGLLLWPDSVERKPSDVQASEHVERRVFEHLLALRCKFHFQSPNIVEATPKATDTYLEWEAINIEQMKQLNDPLLAHWEKYQSYVAQLALCRRLMRLPIRLDEEGFAVKEQTEAPKFNFEGAVPEGAVMPGPFEFTVLDEDTVNLRVEGEDMQAAVDLVEKVLKPHAMRVYGSVTDHPGAKVARELVPWLVAQVRSGKTRVAKSKITDRRGLRDNTRHRDAVISYLCDADILRPTKNKRVTDATSFEIHPTVGSWSVESVE